MQHLSKKYQKGRRVMLSGVILLALTHICGYLPNRTPSNLPVNWTRIITFIPAWVWIVAWSAALIIAVIEVIRKRGRNAISLSVALSVATSAAYLASYITTVVTNGWGSREWFYFGLYAAVALIVSGLLTKVGALKEKGPLDNV